MQNTGKLKYRLDTGQANLALTQGQFELHKLDLDRLIHIDVKHHLSLLTPCHFLIGRFSPLKKSLINIKTRIQQFWTPIPFHTLIITPTLVINLTLIINLI